jgi:hypothetical protein
VFSGIVAHVACFVTAALALAAAVVVGKRKDTPIKSKRAHIVAYLVCAVATIAITIFFNAGSYLVCIPSLLFTLTLLCRGTGLTGSRRLAAALLCYALAVIACALLYAPLAYLIQEALQLWPVTAATILLPMAAITTIGIILVLGNRGGDEYIGPVLVGIHGHDHTP